MPLLKIKTLTSQEGWKSDDGEIISYDVTVQVGDKKAQARTYSKAIAEVGFEGEVQTYDKNEHTYLKQVPKEGSSYGTPFQKKVFGAKPNNSDGQRQGMCIKAATDYIISQNLKLTPGEFVSKVSDYARALYGLDLAVKLDTVVNDISNESLDLSDVKSIFGKE